MKTTSPFDLAVDKPTKTVTINMEFDAELSLVWDAFTKPEILDQWYAPKPFISKTKVMDFNVGGRRFYAMVSPEGMEMWAVQRYTSISPKTNFKFFNAFADKDENLQLPGSDWDLNFSEYADGDQRVTTVRITVFNESLERLEKLLEGFKVGFAMTFENLTNLLVTMSKR